MGITGIQGIERKVDSGDYVFRDSGVSVPVFQDSEKIRRDSGISFMTSQRTHSFVFSTICYSIIYYSIIYYSIICSVNFHSFTGFIRHVMSKTP